MRRLPIILITTYCCVCEFWLAQTTNVETAAAAAAVVNVRCSGRFLSHGNSLYQCPCCFVNGPSNNRANGPFDKSITTKYPNRDSSLFLFGKRTTNGQQEQEHVFSSSREPVVPISKTKKNVNERVCITTTSSLSCPHEAPVPELTPFMYSKWRDSKLGNLTETMERKLLVNLMVEEKSSSLSLKGNKHILEVGCGDGDLALQFLLERKNQPPTFTTSTTTMTKTSSVMSDIASYTAIDASKSMIDFAKERLKLIEKGSDGNTISGTIHFEIGSADALPFQDNEFDIVIAQCILCFLKDPLPTFREIFRVLKPGGHLVIGELGAWSTWALERRFRATFLGSSLWKKAYFRTPQELRKLALKVGLAPGTVKGGIYYPPWSLAAKHLAKYDTFISEKLSKSSGIGAAFLAMKASKIES